MLGRSRDIAKSSDRATVLLVVLDKGGTIRGCRSFPAFTEGDESFCVLLQNAMVLVSHCAPETVAASELQILVFVGDDVEDLVLMDSYQAPSPIY